MTKFLKPCVAGFLLQKELDYLDGAVANPKRPFVAIVGGSKVSSKIGVIEKLIEKVDKIILGCAGTPRLCAWVATGVQGLAAGQGDAEGGRMGSIGSCCSISIGSVHVS